MRLEGSLQGTTQRLEGRAQLTASNLDAFDVPVGAVTAGLQLNGDRVDVVGGQQRPLGWGERADRAVDQLTCA